MMSYKKSQRTAEILLLNGGIIHYIKEFNDIEKPQISLYSFYLVSS